MEERKGSCLCGRVRVTAEPGSNGFGACHCDMCRKWSGGPLLVVECEGGVTLEGTEFIATFDSSEWAQRGFCRMCGTHLFYRLRDHELYAIPLGLFDGEDAWEFEDQIFIDSKPPYYSFAEATANLTGAEAFARFSEE